VAGGRGGPPAVIMAAGVAAAGGPAVERRAGQAQAGLHTAVSEGCVRGLKQQVAVAFLHYLLLAACQVSRGANFLLLVSVFRIHSVYYIFSVRRFTVICIVPLELFNV